MVQECVEAVSETVLLVNGITSGFHGTGVMDKFFFFDMWAI